MSWVRERTTIDALNSTPLESPGSEGLRLNLSVSRECTSNYQVAEGSKHITDQVDLLLVRSGFDSQEKTVHGLACNPDSSPSRARSGVLPILLGLLSYPLRPLVRTGVSLLPRKHGRTGKGTKGLDMALARIQLPAISDKQ